MAKATRSLYQRLANRFTHLAANASDEDEEARRAEEEERTRKAREEGDDEEDEEEEGVSEDEREARRARNERRRAKAAEDEPGDEDGDDDDDEDDEKARKAAARARASERARWADVFASPAAKGRVPLACSLLSETGMSAEKICAVLGASPAESRQGLAARMASVQRPDVGSTTSRAPDALAVDSPKGQAAQLMRAYDKAIGAPSTGG